MDVSVFPTPSFARILGETRGMAVTDNPTSKRQRRTAAEINEILAGPNVAKLSPGAIWTRLYRFRPRVVIGLPCSV